VALCERLGVDCTVRRAPPSPASGNLQAWARDLRYGAAVQLAAGALIATGHTADDQAETVLYRLAASPGRRALLGMAPREGALIRPLLAVTRAQTEAHCVARGLAWRDDASNEDPRFARGRVRHGLLADLRAVHPAAQENLLRSVQLLRAEAEVLDEALAAALAGETRIALDRLAALPRALARLVVIHLAEEVGRTPLPEVGGRVAELLALGSEGSKQLDVGAGVRAVVEYGVLRFAASESTPPPREVMLPLPGRVSFGGWELTATLEPHPAPAAEPGAASLDAERLAVDSLTVRAWRAGDRMQPLGLAGSKTLADLFGERRIPRAQRTSVPIVANAGEIVWVPGVALAERYRPGEGTRRLAVLRATPS
jgi:tRNA(Ile)-lysidine synthase